MTDTGTFIRTALAPTLLAVLIQSLTAIGAFGQEKQVLVQGTWALSPETSPFDSGYPALVYLPAGTIVFEHDKAPLFGYSTVSTHFGYPLQISDTYTSGDKKYKILKRLNYSEDSDKKSFLSHKSSFCLTQSDTITLNDEPCNSIKVGEGWRFTFWDHKYKDGWYFVRAQLDENTLDYLSRYGVDKAEAFFSVPHEEISDLESKGLITRLDRQHPLFSFDVDSAHTVYFPCGQEAVSVEEKRLGWTASASAGAGSEPTFFGWLSAHLKAAFDVEYEAGETEKITITRSSKERSSLFQAAKMVDRRGENPVVWNVSIEKEFECKPSSNKPGDRIYSITFRFFSDGRQPRVYEFSESNIGNYVVISDRIYNKFDRPIFWSINDPKLQDSIIEKIMEEWNVSVNEAHFIYSNINNSCEGSFRENCKKLSREATASAMHSQ